MKKDEMIVEMPISKPFKPAKMLNMFEIAIKNRIPKNKLIPLRPKENAAKALIKAVQRNFSYFPNPIRSSTKPKNPNNKLMVSMYKI